MVALPTFIKYGLSLTTLITILVVAALASIPWYFGTRNRAAEPTRSESALATLWVLFRRVVSACAGALLLWAGWRIAYTTTLADGTMPSGLVGAAVALMGLFCIYVGVFGHGWSADWHNDVALHRDNKRRYKWWF